MKTFRDRLERGWCRTFHPDPMWPIHGHYACPACGRVYPVPWHEAKEFTRGSVASPTEHDPRMAPVGQSEPRKSYLSLQIRGAPR
jgi:hypothetical protein